MCLKASQCWWWELASSPTLFTSASCGHSRTYFWAPRTSFSLVVGLKHNSFGVFGFKRISSATPWKNDRKQKHGKAKRLSSFEMKLEYSINSARESVCSWMIWLIWCTLFVSDDVFFLYFLLVLVVVNHYMAFQYFAQEYYPFSEVSSSQITMHSFSLLIFLSTFIITPILALYFVLVPVWHQGAGILHRVSVGNSFRILRVTVSGGKCSSIHHATRRWRFFFFPSAHLLSFILVFTWLQPQPNDFRCFPYGRCW